MGWYGYYPFLDQNTGDSIDGMIRAAESNLSKTTKKTLVINGKTFTSLIYASL